VIRQSTKIFVITLLLAVAANHAAGQAPTPARIAGIATTAREVRDSGAAWGPRIWPGFRPDTIPLLFVLPGEGTALFGWRADLPVGFRPLDAHPGAGWKPVSDRGAASTAVDLAGRRAAQLGWVAPTHPAPLGLALHDAFLVFAGSAARPGKRFGRG
jgi:hypothetical protein